MHASTDHDTFYVHFDPPTNQNDVHHVSLALNMRDLRPSHISTSFGY